MVLVEIVLTVLGGFSSVLGYVIVDEYIKHRREYRQDVAMHVDQVERLRQRYGREKDLETKVK